MPTPPYGHPLNLAMQTVATVVLWAATAVILAVAVRRTMRDRSALPVLVVFAVAIGSLIEPLYDIAYHLLWYVPGQWTLFTSFDLPQPIWVMPAYVVVFAGPTLYLYPKFAAGVSRREILRYAGLTVVTTAAFETAAINLGLYTYYGPHAFRLFNYPLWISVMEAGQITGFAVLTAALHNAAKRQSALLSVFVLYPAHFAYALLGAGFPALIAINTAAPSMPLLWATAVVSMICAAGALMMVSGLLPERVATTANTSSRGRV